MPARTSSLLLTLLLLAACSSGSPPPADAGVDHPASDVPTDEATPPDVAVDVLLDAAPDVPPVDVPPMDVPPVDVAADIPPVDVAADVAADIAIDSTPDVAIDVSPDVPPTRACRTDVECGTAGVCDRSRSLCVECLTRDDCPGADRVCASGRCAAAERCTASRTCVGQVCDTARMQCVDCLVDADCDSGFGCVANRCFAARACRSARECNDRGQTCDTASMLCVDCLVDADCDRGRLCAPGGVCRAQVCTPGAADCAGAGTRRVCNSDGRGYATTACAAGQACRDGACVALACAPGAATCVNASTRSVCNADGTATAMTPCAASQSCRGGSCLPWVCTPGATRCTDARTVELCAADGLDRTTTACPSGGACSGGACASLVCTPGAVECVGVGARRVCNVDGLGYTPQTCAAGTACASGICQMTVCTPGATACVDAMSVRTCNSDGLGYATRACAARETCEGGACAPWVCTPGAVDCSGTSRRVCNANGLGYAATPCPAPPNASAACAGAGVCGYTCNAGYTPTAGGCGAPSAAPVTPGVGVRVRRRPTFRWSLDGGADGARLEVCRDAACATVVITQNVTGTSVTTTALPTGTLYWRVTGRAGTTLGPTPSPTRAVVVTASSPDRYDITGDGYADLVVSNSNNYLFTYFGGPTGLPSSPSRVNMRPGTTYFATRILHAGDLNGDGFADVIAHGNEGGIYAFHGSATGLSEGPRFANLGFTSSTPVTVVATGDVNGDGYDDAAVTTNSGSSVSLSVYHGSPSGLATGADTVFSVTRSGTRLSAIGDVNGDGYADIAVSAPSTTVSTLTVYYGSAAGIVEASAATLTGPASPNSTFTAAPIGDMNGDGYGDVALGSYTSSSPVDRVFVLLGSASGLRLPPTSALTGTSGDTTFGQVILGGGSDLDGDAIPDFLVTGPYARHWLIRGTSTGAGVSGVVLPFPVMRYSSYLPTGIIGDTDGDGLVEMALGDGASSGGYVHLYRWNPAVGAPVIYRTISATDSTQVGLGGAIAN